MSLNSLQSMFGPGLIFTLFSCQLHAPPTVVQNAVDKY